MKKVYLLGLLICCAGLSEARSVYIINNSSFDISVKGPAKQAVKVFAQDKIEKGKSLEKEIEDSSSSLDFIFGATDPSVPEVKKYSKRYTKDGVIVIKDDPAEQNGFKLFFTDNFVNGALTSVPL